MKFYTRGSRFKERDWCSVFGARGGDGMTETEKVFGSGRSDPSSSDRAGLPSSLFELRRDMMPRLKMRPPASPSCRLALRAGSHRGKVLRPGGKWEGGKGIRCRPTSPGYEFVEGSPSVVSPGSNHSGSNDSGPNGSSQPSRVKYKPLTQITSWAGGIDLASYV
jgi:hypothetical protein